MESNGLEQATGRGVEYDYQTLTYLELLGDGRLSKAYNGFYESAGENVSELNNQLADIDQSKSRDFVQREVMRIFLSGGMLEQSTYVGHGLKSNEYIGEKCKLGSDGCFRIVGR